MVPQARRRTPLSAFFNAHRTNCDWLLSGTLTSQSYLRPLYQNNCYGFAYALGPDSVMAADTVRVARSPKRCWTGQPAEFGGNPMFVV